MTVYLVGAGPGDPGLLTVRGAEVLAVAEVVVYDRLSSASLLDLAPSAAERMAVGKQGGGPSADQAAINALLVERGRRGQRVVRLKGGDPFVFARGGEEAAALADAGVPFEIVPGITSAIAVPAYAGIPVTSRGVATSFTVVTGHEDPWASTETDWEAVARVGGTIVVLMGTATRAAIAARLQAGGLAADTPVAAVTWGTRPEQRTLRTTLAALADADVAAPAVIVIGDVAALDLSWFEQRPLFGRRVVVTRSAAQADGLSGRLVAAGALPVEVPVVDVAAPADGGVALAAAAARLGDWDWVAFASPNAVERLADHVRDGRAFGAAGVAAVGPGTADALRRRLGIVADVVAERSVAEGLVDAMPPGPGRVLVPRAAEGRPALADGLRARGFVVDEVEAYRSVAVTPPPDAVAAAAGADAIAFASGSTVRAWVSAVGVPSTPPVIACIGPTTAEAATAAGLHVTAVADPHTLDGLVDALRSALAGTAGTQRAGHRVRRSLRP